MKRMDMTTPTRGGKKQEQSNTELTVAEKRKNVGQSKRASNNQYDSKSTISNSSATSSRKNRKGKESPICASKLKNNHVDDYMNKWKLEKEKEKEQGNSEKFSESDVGDDEIVNYQCPNCIFSCLKYMQFHDHMLMKHGKSVFCCVTDECINPFPAIIEYFTPSFYAGDKYICFSEKNPNAPITNIFVHF